MELIFIGVIFAIRAKFWYAPGLVAGGTVTSWGDGDFCRYVTLPETFVGTKGARTAALRITVIVEMPITALAPVMRLTELMKLAL